MLFTDPQFSVQWRGACPHDPSTRMVLFWKRQDTLDEKLVQYGTPPKAQEQVPTDLTPCRSTGNGSASSVGLSSSSARFGATDLSEELNRLTARENALTQQLAKWDLGKCDAAHEAFGTSRDEVPSEVSRHSEMGILQSELDLVRASIGVTASRCSSMSSGSSARPEHGAAVPESEFDSNACAAMIKSAKSESQAAPSVIEVVSNLLKASPLAQAITEDHSPGSTNAVGRMASNHDTDAGDFEMPSSQPVADCVGTRLKSKPRPVRRNKSESNQDPPRISKPAPAPVSRMLAKDLEYWLPQSSSSPSPSARSRRGADGRGRSTDRSRLTDRSRPSCREAHADTTSSASMNSVTRHRQQRRARASVPRTQAKETAKTDPGTWRAADRSRSLSRTSRNIGAPLTTAQPASSNVQEAPDVVASARTVRSDSPESLRLAAARDAARLYALLENAEGSTDESRTAVDVAVSGS